MQYLKKYFTEGLIQMAILLSLSGVRVDVGLEPYLPPSWHEMILGPTSALTQTQFHNLRNRLEDGQSLHPKSVDLDGFFTARRLLGWVRSLDRLQVPHAELETWLVQREPEPLPVVFPDQASPLVRAPAGVERDRISPPVESRAALGTLQEEEEEDEQDKEEETHHVLNHSGALDERGEEEEEEEEEEDLDRMHRSYRRAGGGGRPGGSYNHANNGELTQNEVDQTSFSLQECLRLLEETFPFTEEQQLHNVGGRGDLECQSPDREPLMPPIIPTGNPSLDLELEWQDLLSIMEPENTEVNMMTPFDHTRNSRATGTLHDVRSEALQLNCNNHDNDVTEADQEVLMETPQQQGSFGPPSQSEPVLFPLTPSADLDDHSLAFNTMDTSTNSNVYSWHSPPDNTDLLAEDPSEGFLGLSAEDNSSTFNINLLTQDLVDTIESSPCSQYAPYPENLPTWDVNFHSCNMTASSFTLSPEGNGMIQDLLTSPSSVFLSDEEDVENENSLPSSLSDLLEDAAILDEFRLLDLALEEGFTPEIAARLEEEGYLGRGIAQQETGKDDDHLGSSTSVTEDHVQPRGHQQDSENEAESDSGLSLDFSHSPASPSASEASSYSSSSSSSSCVSDEGSPFSEDEDKDAEDGLVGVDMELEVTIKQEELEEEEMGAVGGGYPEDVKKQFPPNYENDKLFNGFPWLEHIGHDHTYNQPWPSASSPSLGKMSTKHTKSSLRHDSARPYRSSRHISETKMWSRDERRARALKVPFSNELIVNLPVEEFNDLLANGQLNEDQLTLIRDIRRRGKNKIAAQNCRQRKMDVLLGLKDDVSGLRRYRSRLLREKQEALRNLQEMKRQLGMLYQEVFSTLRDEEGRSLDAMEYLLNFEPNGSVTVASRQQGAAMPLTKTSKKQRDKKK
ncbi:endoplasmic reticulum membrane sensor NFE2L1a isoform X1 [Dicentrarchus labrax]|uniref:Endoplasmic reticulum membrane sensor NFE2L1 n=1 Tax=Dicentrarchus labrax TaxID=13489 RepID=A0A8P4FZ13_DICLA|nr:endoplasmic reticulum membrane sensor NFE2L1a isoform X1 [Dicentrarchus labrax]